MTSNDESYATLIGETTEFRHNSQPMSRSAKEIRDWVILKFAEVLGIDPEEIDLSEPLTSYGVGSIQALTLVAELEDWMERTLPVTLLWDCSTLDEVIKYLSEAPAT
jgi:acyl carrier protein